MEAKHKELLEAHRNQFIETIEVERLDSFLEESEVFTQLDISEINKQTTPAAKVEKLLDLLPVKGTQAFQQLCVALETTYPHLLTIMFLGGSQKVTDSRSTSLTSDSSEDGLRTTPQDTVSDDSSNQNSLQTAYQPSIPPPPSAQTTHHYDPCQNNVSLLKAELKMMSEDRDVLRDELQRVQTKLDNYKKLSMSGEAMKLSGKHVNRDYDWLKSQCDWAMNELQSLKRQHGETAKKCDQAVKEADHYRHKYKVAAEKVDQNAHEIHIVKSQYNEVLAEKQRLEQEVLDLQRLHEEDKHEMAELRKQQREVINESGSSEVLNKMYDTAVGKYENVKKDYDSLRERYTDLRASHNGTNSKLELMQEENARLRRQVEEATQEFKTAVLERNGLKQQCTAAIRNWDKAIREKNELEEKCNRAIQQKEDLRKEINQALALNLQFTKDIARLKEERNAAMQEYSLIMSERDSVHKEIEQLQEKLSETQKRLEEIDKEKKGAKDDVETLKREIASALHDRDHTMKKVNDLKEQFGDVVSEKVEAEKEIDEARKDIERLTQQCSVARRERREAIEHRDLILQQQYEKTQKELAEGKDLASKETEMLRKEIDRLQCDLEDALQEAEVSKRRRDWAFSERDKIVLERESIRTLCDKLRRERDRAVSELAEALRDSDELKKHKNEATKDLKELRERYESMLEKESRKHQLEVVGGHNHSRDSAIDTDLQEWETETLEFDIGGVSTDDLGFELVGGKDDPQFPNDCSIFVSSVVKGGCADGKLKKNDQVLKVNNIDVTNVEKKIALQAVRKGGGVINMVVRRRKSSTTKMVQPVHLNLAGGRDLGISVEQGQYISRIAQGSAAAREGNLAVGDRVLHINGRSIEGCGPAEVMQMVQENSGSVVLSVLKYSPMPQNSIVPSTTFSSHSHGESSPEQPSISPKSRTRLWDVMPHGSKNYQDLKTGSQTDSLDSGEPGHHKQSHHHQEKQRHSMHPDNLLDKAYQKIFGKSRHGSEEKDAVTKSGHAIPNNVTSSGEDEAIAGFNDILQIYAKNNISSKPKEKRRRDKEQENGGTWPKCRAPVDYTTAHAFQPVIPKRKERTALSVIMNENTHNIGSIYQARSVPYTKVPPTPPERGDSSFAASIRHSPQNSDSSMKYPAMPSVSHTLPHSMSQAKSSKSTYSSSPEKQSNLHSMADPILRDKSSSLEDSKPANFVTSASIAMHFPGESAPDSSSPVDYTVVSANKDQNVLDYYTKRNHSGRPTSAPSRNRKERLHQAQLAHGTLPRADPNSNKPMSLNIQPIYSPRPIPHTGHSITPTEHHISPRQDKPPMGAFTPMQAKASQSYPSSIGPSSMVRSTTAVSTYMASSQRVSPSSHVHSHAPVLSQSMPTSPRYSSPPGYVSPRGESILNSSIPEMDADHTPYYLRNELRNSSASPSPSHHSSTTLDRSTPTPSEELNFPYPKIHPRAMYGRAYDVGDGCSTFPKRGHHAERIRIASNQSVTSKSSMGKISTSSIEKVSDRSSPMSPFVPVMDMIPAPSSSGSLSKSNTDTSTRKRKSRPKIGETRSIYVEKSSEPLGIQIQTGSCGGIFVSSVSENSLAWGEGICIGDQLLEVCGINMRNATYNLAANVLRQCGDSITMLVQYNPKKYQDGDSSSAPSSAASSATNTPEPGRNQRALHHVSNETITSATPTNSPHMSGSSKDEKLLPCEPRFVFLEKKKANLGVGLVGGNAVGIFVQDVQPDSVAAGPNGLRCGDQILELNGVNVRSATAEQAAYELQKLVERLETVSILAQYHIAKYKKVRDKIHEEPGDSLYVRALFDRQAENDGQLSFKKDDILYIDNTLYNGILGLWRAWLIDDEGNKLQCGTIPSKTKLEDELALKRSISEASQEEEHKSGSRRGSASARRSFFRRKRHQRNNSKDSRELNSFSDASINSDSVPILDDGTVLTFQRVERLDCKVSRPVVILGPLAEPLINKLTSESPDKYCRCELAILPVLQDDSLFVEFKPVDGHYECITIASVKEIINKNRHCMLDVSPPAVERLHKVKIYPIVIFIKHKNPKQIREVKDTRFLPEKVSNRAAKEYFETFQRYEQEFKHHFSEIIPGGNLAMMSNRIKSAIRNEQKKPLWIPSGSLW